MKCAVDLPAIFSSCDKIRSEIGAIVCTNAYEVHQLRLSFFVKALQVYTVAMDLIFSFKNGDYGYFKVVILCCMVHLEIDETQRINHHTGINSSDMFSVDLPIWIFPEHFLTMYSEYQRLIGKSVLPDIPLTVRIIARVAKWESKRYSLYKAII